MLIRYKKNQEKIAMGLLSFMPEERDVKVLQQTMKEYETNPDWHLFLWREEDEIVGTIGLKIENDLNVVVQHISVNPAYRNLGIGKKIVNEVQVLYGEKYDVCANELTQEFYFQSTTAANKEEDKKEDETSQD